MKKYSHNYKIRLANTVAIVSGVLAVIVLTVIGIVYKTWWCVAFMAGFGVAIDAVRSSIVEYEQDSAKYEEANRELNKVK